MNSKRTWLTALILVVATACYRNTHHSGTEIGYLIHIDQQSKPLLEDAAFYDEGINGKLYEALSRMSELSAFKRHISMRSIRRGMTNRDVQEIINDICTSDHEVRSNVFCKRRRAVAETYALRLNLVKGML